MAPALMLREEAYFTKRRVIVRGKTVKHGQAKKTNNLLSYKPNLPFTVNPSRIRSS